MSRTGESAMLLASHGDRMPDVVDGWLRAQLERSIRAIVDAIGGDGACLRIGYSCAKVEAGSGFSPDGRHPNREHRFYVIVEHEIKGAILGTNGKNAERIRELVRMRTRVLQSRDPVDLRVISNESEAPDGAFT